MLLDVNGRSVVLRPFLLFKGKIIEVSLSIVICGIKIKMLYIEIYTKENEINFLLYTLKSKLSKIKQIIGKQQK